VTTYSAKGTKLNRRGLETREHILHVAVKCLAAGGPDAVSANLIAREAGVTWGTVQHQFGDADGLWAEVLAELSKQVGAIFSKVVNRRGTLSSQVKGIVETVWRSLDSSSSQAAFNLRYSLPHDQALLAKEFPQSAQALSELDRSWGDAWARAFAGLDVPKAKVRKVRSLVPSALRGLHTEARLGTYTDIHAARAGLIESLTAYLEKG
jgi:AcrR family transcriptional regulator